MLELEDPRVVLITGVFVRNQLDITARLWAHQRRTRLLPDERPVLRVTYPERCCSRLMAKLGMALPRWMGACLHALLSHI